MPSYAPTFSEVAMERGHILWERTKHDDNLFTNRSGFFMVVQGLLLQAAMDAGVNTKLRLWILAVAGMAVCAAWMWMTYRHLRLRNWLWDELKSVPGFEGPVNPSRPGIGGSMFGAHKIMGYYLPLLLLGLWLVLGFT